MICATNANTIVPDVPFGPFEKTFENTVVKSQANTNASDVPCVYFWYQFHRSLRSDDMCRKTNLAKISDVLYSQMYFFLRCTFWCQLHRSFGSDDMCRKTGLAKISVWSGQSPNIGHSRLDILHFMFQ